MVKLHNSEEEHFASTKFCENIIGCEKKKKKKKAELNGEGGGKQGHRLLQADMGAGSELPFPSLWHLRSLWDLRWFWAFKDREEKEWECSKII